MTAPARPSLTWRGAAVVALPVWLASRVALVLLTAVGAYVVRPGTGRDLPGFLEQWENWDVAQFQKIAMFGYFSPEYADRTEAFFPGMPFALRVVHAVVPEWTAAGLVVSFLAGGVATVALARLASIDGDALAAQRAVLFLVLFPYAAFLFAGYSEALFLAFAVPAWLAARQDRWWLAGLLGAGAATTRITAVALGAALAVQWLQQRWAAGLGWRGLVRADVLALALPALPVVAYFGWLRSKTGRWDAYAVALEEGWGRTTVAPWEGFRNTWRAATDPGTASAFLWSYRAELLVVVIGVVVTAVLLRERRLGEAAFVGLSTYLLSSASYYASNVRGMLLWFPFFLLLARLTARRDWLAAAVVWVCAPLCAGLALAFTRGSWLG